MSDETRAFLLDIQAVCEKHGKVLVPSGYDTLQVWPLDRGDIDEYLMAAEDKT